MMTINVTLTEEDECGWDRDFTVEVTFNEKDPFDDSLTVTRDGEPFPEIKDNVYYQARVSRALEKFE